MLKDSVTKISLVRIDDEILKEELLEEMVDSSVTPTLVGIRGACLFVLTFLLPAEAGVTDEFLCNTNFS